MNTPLEEMLAVLHGKNRFILTTHVNPDGDGLGSEVALAESLADRQKQVSILNVSATPTIYQFLDPHHRVQQFEESVHQQLIADAEAIVVLDTNHPGRLRAMERYVVESTAVKMCIDHHLDPAPFADQYFIDDDATSTGELLYRLLMQFQGTSLPPLIAQALYCAIMTDTGSFRYPRVDPEIHQIIAHLIECGADPVTIYQQVYERWSPGRIRLLGELLANITMAHAGKVAAITVTRESLSRTGTTEEETDNFTVYPMSIQGVIIGLLFLELPDGIKVSFRSKGNIPVNELAKEFGGNGHLNAAGAQLQNGS
ncbi:MAG: bifunctional oligoribonuclease/PAP phosphatase NrnA, partial [Ignavibacteria bacterium]|nr:bifunctional oligoribonuclease/PAP phosphatase NrnA [Ignavibacteria bacterium]